MKRAKSKRSNPPSRRATTTAAPPSTGRRRVFRVAAMVLGPLVLLALFEAFLRLAGVGHPTSFFLPMRINGTNCLVENDRFGWPFFGPDVSRAPSSLAFPTEKSPGTVRIFVLGESAAFGDPQPEFGLGRMLQALLEGRFPDRHFEVINTAMTAINSHVIVPIARDCSARQGDFWVVYMGNNEVVGPYGAGTVFGRQAASIPLVRASVALRASRTGQLLGDLARRAVKHPVNQSEWGGMGMFLQNHVLQDDPRMDTVYANYRRNLNDIIDYGLDGGAKVLVSTVAVNLKDCGPFASGHRPGLTEAELLRWTNASQAGRAAQEAGKSADALAAFQQALSIDDTYAEAHFRAGQSLLALGRDAEAAREFGAARDQDTLRFRADSRINGLVREVASSRRKDGVLLVDSEAAIAAQSPHGLTGDEFLHEHVHLNFEGNYLLARGVAEQIADVLPAPSPRPWPTQNECARRLAWNDFTRRAGEMEILSRLRDPPFTEQANNHEQRRLLAARVEQLQSAVQPSGIRDALVQTQKAAAASPGDWILQQNLARIQQQTGDVSGAVASWKNVIHSIPQSPDAWENLGLALERAGDDDQAIEAFQHAVRLAPESVVSLNSLGELYARQNHPDKAAEEFQKVLQAKPYWGPAHLGLGKALEAAGKTNEAALEFEQAYANRITTSDSFNMLAKFAFARGWYGRAATNFADALRINPVDPETQVNLGVTLGRLGRNAEAKAHYLEAIRLQPNFAEGHFCYGLELGQEGDSAGAAAEFSDAVRLKPDLIEARLNLGIALAHQNLNQQALEQFQEVLRRDPKNSLALARVKALQGTPSPAP